MARGGMRRLAPGDSGRGQGDGSGPVTPAQAGPGGWLSGSLGALPSFVGAAGPAIGAAGPATLARTADVAGGLVLDVAEYGPLGTSDDSATFQGAFSAAAGAGGALVVAPSGSYRVTGLRVGSGVKIW